MSPRTAAGLTLREAILTVLKSYPDRTLRPIEIAEAIHKRGLYDIGGLGYDSWSRVGPDLTLLRRAGIIERPARGRYRIFTTIGDRVRLLKPSPSDYWPAGATGTVVCRLGGNLLSVQMDTPLPSGLREVCVWLSDVEICSAPPPETAP